jgi:hypothetical protein
MSFLNKLKWILGILVVFLLIIATNLIDRNNFVKVRNSVVSIYEDRLVVKGLILDMTDIVHKKELAIVQEDSVFYADKINSLNQEMNLLISRFEKTELTKQENKKINELKTEHKILVKHEKQLSAFTSEAFNSLRPKIDELKAGLKSLSNIQLKEGKRQMLISKKAVDSVELFTQIEIYFLVFLAIIIQLIVMYKPKNKMS